MYITRLSRAKNCAYLLGPRRLVSGVDGIFVVVQLLLLGRLPRLLLLLLLLVLKGHQVGPLLLELPLETLGLPLFLMLLTLVLLHTHTHTRKRRQKTVYD